MKELYWTKLKVMDDLKLMGWSDDKVSLWLENNKDFYQSYPDDNEDEQTQKLWREWWAKRNYKTEVK